MATKKNVPVEKPAEVKTPENQMNKHNETAADDLAQMERNAEVMLQDLRRKSEKAEASKGALNRKLCAPIRADLINAKRELAALMPEAKRIHALGSKYLAPGVKLHPNARSALEGWYLKTLAGLLNGGMIHGCDEVIEAIDNTRTDDPNRLKLVKDCAAGPLSGPGTVREILGKILSIARNPVVKTVAQVEVEHHPLAIEDTEGKRHGSGRVISNIEHDA